MVDSWNGSGSVKCVNEKAKTGAFTLGLLWNLGQIMGRGGGGGQEEETHLNHAVHRQHVEAQESGSGGRAWLGVEAPNMLVNEEDSWERTGHYF